MTNNDRNEKGKVISVVVETPPPRHEEVITVVVETPPPRHETAVVYLLSQEKPSRRG